MSRMSTMDVERSRTGYAGIAVQDGSMGRQQFSSGASLWLRHRNSSLSGYSSSETMARSSSAHPKPRMRTASTATSSSSHTLGALSHSGSSGFGSTPILYEEPEVADLGDVEDEENTDYQEMLRKFASTSIKKSLKGFRSRKSPMPSSPSSPTTPPASARSFQSFLSDDARSLFSAKEVRKLPKDAHSVGSSMRARKRRGTLSVRVARMEVEEAEDGEGGEAVNKLKALSIVSKGASSSWSYHLPKSPSVRSVAFSDAVSFNATSLRSRARTGKSLRHADNESLSYASFKTAEEGFDSVQLQREVLEPLMEIPRAPLNHTAFIRGVRAFTERTPATYAVGLASISIM